MPETKKHIQSRRLLCEGWLEPDHTPFSGTGVGADAGLVYEPSVVFVKQGDKACFFKGKSDQLNESIGDVQIVESINELETINDAQGKKQVVDGEWIVEGVFQRSNVKNANGRTYSRKLWERVLNDKADTQKAIRERGMTGHLEHPANGRTDGNLSALLILKAQLQEDGTVYGRAQLLDTPPGKILQEYCIKDVRWGFSSRGSGTIRSDGVVDENDFRLETWDSVMRPSTPGAYATKPDATVVVKPTEAVVVEEMLPEAAIKVLTDESDAICAELEKVEEADLGLLQRFMRHFSAINKNDRKLPEKTRDGLRSKSEVCVDLLNKKFTAPSAMIVETVTKTLDEMVEEDSSAAIRQAAFERVVTKFKHQIKEVSGQLEDKGCQLTEAQTKLNKASRRLSKMESERTTLLSRTGELERALHEMQSQLDAARQFIAESTSAEISDPVSDHIRTIIENEPGYEQFRDVLERADSKERVNALVETLATAVKPVPPSRGQIAETGDRSALPQGNVVSESDTRTRVTTRHQGAVLAAKAIHRGSHKVH